MLVLLIVFIGCKKEDEEEPVPSISISGITVTPETSEVPKGYALEFTATVNGNNLTEAEKAVTWTVSGGMKQGTTISTDGTLVIAEDETAQTLIIKATSTADNSKSGIATVRVYELQNFRLDCTEGANLVEIVYLGENILCNYVDGLYIVQGDIIIKDDNDDFDNPNPQDNISTRAVMADNNRTWPQGKVYYYLDPKFTAILNSSIRTAMKTIETKSNNNIKFIELLTTDAIERLNATAICFVPSDKNSSPVGFSSLKYIYLQDPECALHEICHLIGLQHEQSRSDRDLYVNINWNNIDEDKKHNFTMIDNMRYYSPTSDFDFCSVMMYHPYSFAKDKSLATITKKDGSPYKTQLDTLSNDDILVINNMYPKEPIVQPTFFTHKNNIEPTTNSCEIVGEIIYEGSPALTEYGIVYRELNNSTAPYIYQSATNKDNFGKYKCLLSNLNPNTTYEAGAYVVHDGRIDPEQIEMVTFTTQGTAQNEYYQGASGYVKFNWYNYSSGDYYIGSTEYFGDVIFLVISGGGDQFYLEKIDDTRYFIKYGDKYVVPALPSVAPGVNIRNVCKFTVVSTTPNGDNLHDYTYTFPHYTTFGGKSYYRIKSGFIGDALSIDLLGNVDAFYVGVNFASLHLDIQGGIVSDHIFAIEEINR